MAGEKEPCWDLSTCVTPGGGALAVVSARRISAIALPLFRGVLAIRWRISASDRLYRGQSLDEPEGFRTCARVRASEDA